MDSTQNGSNPRPTQVERTSYSGNLMRDPLPQVDPEIWDLIKKVYSTVVFKLLSFRRRVVRNVDLN